MSFLDFFRKKEKEHIADSSAVFVPTTTASDSNSSTADTAPSSGGDAGGASGGDGSGM